MAGNEPAGGVGARGNPLGDRKRYADPLLPLLI
jgi:hypothetical protein